MTVFELTKPIFKNNLKKYNFITENSRDLDIKFIFFAEKNIDRPKYVIELSMILNDINKAILLEKGIFEFALIHTFMNGILEKFVISVYLDKIDEIKNNINGDKKINNQTLKQSILLGEIGPELVSFLSPQQMHPARWAGIMNIKKYREDKENNIATTDLYKCRKCGERKAKISQMQIRCADEPTSTFVTCLVCYNTFVI
jgi:DNA-directed RNA polymerase subunit M/transcription elongation factor TFIIS